MYSFLNKNGTSLAFGVSALLILICIAILSSRSISYKDAFQQAGTSEDVAKIAEPEAKNQKTRELSKEILQESDEYAVGPLLGLGQILAVVCMLVAIGFPVYLMIGDKRKLLITSAVLVSAIVIWFVFYGAASSVIPNVDFDYTPSESKTTGALVGIIILGTFVALGTIIWGEINKLIKER